MTFVKKCDFSIQASLVKNVLGINHKVIGTEFGYFVKKEK